jgi:glycerophosphoryl diester phosphodiesterase
LAKELPTLPRTLLVEGRDGARWLSEQGLREAATFATDIGPATTLLVGRPEIVRRAHEAGLTVTPYTFTTRRAPGAPAPRFTDVSEEMTYYLFELNVDALFTDNPDRFPREPQRRREPSKRGA